MFYFALPSHGWIGGVANDEAGALFFEVTFAGRHLSCDAAAI
jgi:hypothetical protein